MRGHNRQQVSMLTLRTPEQMVPREHPIRRVKALADETLTRLGDVFEAMYSPVGRPSIPPERLLKASLLMALYTVRSERLFCEQLGYNMLYRWFLDMGLDEEPFDASSFSHNRQRLLAHEVAPRFFAEVVGLAQQFALLSNEHFTVDGTLIEAWASMKSFRPKDEKKDDQPPPDDPGNPSVDFHGEKRSNETHASKTDPDARLARKGKGKESKLAYQGHALMDNRHGLVRDFTVTCASGTAERETALAQLALAVVAGASATVGADKSYDTHGFVEGCRALNVTPHVAQNHKRNGGSAIDGRTTRHPGYAVSQRLRKLVEQIFGWGKTVGSLRKTRFRGRERVEHDALLSVTAYNLLRIARLRPAVA